MIGGHEKVLQFRKTTIKAREIGVRADDDAKNLNGDNGNFKRGFHPMINGSRDRCPPHRRRGRRSQVKESNRSRKSQAPCKQLGATKPYPQGHLASELFIMPHTLKVDHFACITVRFRSWNANVRRNFGCFARHTAVTKSNWLTADWKVLDRSN